MAIVTKALGTFHEYANGDDQPPTGSFRAEYDYDDATFRVTAGRAVNTTSQPGRVQLIRHSDGRVYTVDCPANDTIEQSVPTTGGNRIQLTVEPSGKLDGCDVNVYWPV